MMKILITKSESKLALKSKIFVENGIEIEKKLVSSHQ